MRLVKLLLLAWLLSAIVLLWTTPSRAYVEVRVQIGSQRMIVEVDGVHYAAWAVSTARRGYRTPPGVYRPYLLERMHYSRLYDYTPMPYSVFFHRGYAIHGTTEVRRLGRPVSHGCIRLRTDHARTLYGLIRRHGLGATRIEIVR